MNYNEALNYIHSIGNFKLEPSLKRMEKVAEILNNPQSSFPAIHIAGTNGKGSVCAMLNSIFKAAGYKTGLYISPFIIDFRERIQVNGEFISREDLCRLSQKVKDTSVQLNEFEFITAVAFLYFEEQGCDIVICETGLGGRFDATNILGDKRTAVITKIGLDHTEILGDTLEKITAEKCGIIKNCPVVSNPNQPKISKEYIMKYTDNKVVLPNLDGLVILANGGFIYEGKEYKLSLRGDFQIENALTAIEAVRCSGFNIPYEIIAFGLENTFFPARMEKISNNPEIYLDGAHNPDGAAALASELKRQGGGVTAVVAAMKDKEVEKVLSLTLPYCKNVVVTQVDNMPRSMPKEQLAAIAEKYCSCTVAKNYSNAIDKAIELCNNRPIFIFGSLYFASDLRPILKEKFK